MQRVGGVPEGAALDITFLARDDVGAPHAQRFCQWLVETQSCRYTSVVNYLNGLVSMMNFVYFELNVEESVLSMSPNPLEQLANLRDQANGQVKQQNLFSPTSIRGGWIAWAQVQETRVKIMSGVNARPPTATLKEAAIISLMSLLPPDRVGVCLPMLERRDRWWTFFPTSSADLLPSPLPLNRSSASFA